MLHHDFEHLGIRLSPHEITCLHYVSKKYDIHRIAKKMELSHRTVAFYLKGIMLRLKCETIPQLIDRIEKSKK